MKVLWLQISRKWVILDSHYKMTKQVIRGHILERSKYAEIGRSQELMYAFQNGFQHEKGHILFLKLGISTVVHQIPRLVFKF